MSKYSKFLVAIQFLCFAYFLFGQAIFCDGYLLLLQFFGFFISVWGVFALKIGNFNIQPELRAGAKFIRSGPYRWVRNPMYLGILFFFGATVIQGPEKLNILMYLILSLVFILKIHREEKFLTDQFGNSYLEYKKKTNRLLPYIF
jgi:protein-S-isoprenylcysteine O-methyltransferase Ste14